MRELLKKIESELALIKDKKERIVQSKRLKVLWEKYEGDDKIISSEELREEIEAEKEKDHLMIYTKIPALDRIIDGFREGNLIVVSAPTKMGKCFGKGTKILMYNGSVKKVEDIVIGDKLMGINSKPRTVLNLGGGREEMYLITLKDGSSFKVNKSHILSLKTTGLCNKSKYKGKVTSKRYSKGNIVNLSVEEYLNKSKTFKHNHKSYKSSVNFKSKELGIDPYFLGIWLGDGTSDNTAVTTADNEVIDYLYKYADKLKLRIRISLQKDNKSVVVNLVNKKGYKNKLRDLLRKYGVWKNKHIPFDYKINSRKNRLKLLAGLIDSDGSCSAINCIEFVNKNENLINDVIFLARSLGFYSRKGLKEVNGVKYYRISINGDVGKIPVLLERKTKDNRKPIKEPLTQKFEVKSIGIDDYYGFEIDGNDKLFLLNSFTVVHNTTLCQTFTIEFAEQDINCLWFSYEVPMFEFMDKFGDNPPLFYIPKQLKGNTMTWLEERIVESIAKFNTKVVFIDHLHYIVDMNARNQNMSLQIGSVMRNLKKIALKYNIVIFIVAHMKHIKMVSSPDLEDLRDSSFIAQEADIVLMMRRNEDDSGENFLNTADLFIKAHRRTGENGTINLIHSRGRFNEIQKNNQ